MSNKIKEIRLEKGLSCKQLADLTQISCVEIKDIEEGKCDIIKTSIMCKIAKAFGLKVEEVF